MVADAAISTAVLKLADLLKRKTNFLRGVAEEVQLLKDELEGVQRFLRQATDVEIDDEMMHNWMSETREIAHDAEDAVEVFIFKVERARMMVGRFASSPNHIYRLNKFSRLIKSIRKRLRGVEKSCRHRGLRDSDQRPSDGVRSSNASKNLEPLPLTQWAKDKHVVGIEKDIELLLKKAIFEENDGLSITAITGEGGIGKSTFARKVYNHGAVAGRFERRAWAVASKEAKPREVIKELVLQMVKPIESERVLIETVENSVLPKVLEVVRQRLQGRRYFIVLDDVWDDALWDCLANAFPDEGNGSRLLITSRSPVMTDHTKYVHAMEYLDTDQSWLLLNNTISIQNPIDEDVKEIGRQIVNKCNGLPLAITLVGGLLKKQNQSMYRWHKVLEKINSYLTPSRNDAMQAILELSYQNLDPKLKSCFMCLSFFKEDDIIRARKLADIWIAQGLIPQEDESTMDETAMSFLHGLIDQNIVQIEDTTIDGRVKTCLVHDLILDLSITKAKEEICLEILNEDGRSESSLKPRYRVIYCDEGRFKDSIYGNKQIRSLILRGARPYLFTTSFSSYWMSFQLLRVLDFQGCKLMTRLPSAVSSLIGLRYLSLRDTGVSDLPNSLPSLKNLLVLDLQGLLPVEMSDILGKMCSLHHLYADAFYFQKIPEITGLKNLQTLNYVNFSEADIFQVTHMISLRKLGINLFRISSGTRLLFLLERLQNLDHLNLKYCRDLDLDKLQSMRRVMVLKLKGEMPSLPRGFPPNLVRLSLIYTRLKEDPMPALQNLPKLEYLKLETAYDGKEMVVSGGGFPVLKALKLQCFWSLRDVRVEEGGLPELGRLEIRQCRVMERLPGEMRNLEELKIAASEKIAAKVRGEDSYKVSDIPYVQIIDDQRLEIVQEK